MPCWAPWPPAISAASSRPAIRAGKTPTPPSFSTWLSKELQHAGYRIVNIDTTLVLAAPKIVPIAGEMRARVADLLGIGIDQISIKAKTPEGLNLDHVAQCHAVALVERAQEPDELKSMSA
jgi:2-C-methyl-D-erythritol 2,4-cyclodiphosphate synthase